MSSVERGCPGQASSRLVAHGHYLVHTVPDDMKDFRYVTELV